MHNQVKIRMRITNPYTKSAECYPIKICKLYNSSDKRLEHVIVVLFNKVADRLLDYIVSVSDNSDVTYIVTPLLFTYDEDTIHNTIDKIRQQFGSLEKINCYVLDGLFDIRFGKRIIK